MLAALFHLLTIIFYHLFTPRVFIFYFLFLFCFSHLRWLANLDMAISDFGSMDFLDDWAEILPIDGEVSVEEEAVLLYDIDWKSGSPFSLNSSHQSIDLNAACGAFSEDENILWALGSAILTPTDLPAPPLSSSTTSVLSDDCFVSQPFPSPSVASPVDFFHSSPIHMDVQDRDVDSILGDVALTPTGLPSSPYLPSIESLPPEPSTDHIQCNFGSCKKICSSKSDFNHHYKNHSRPFKCEACSSSWATSGHLNRHMNSCHKRTEKYYCTVSGCSRSNDPKGEPVLPFWRSDTCSKHMRKVHGLGKEEAKHCAMDEATAAIRQERRRGRRVDRNVNSDSEE